MKRVAVIIGLLSIVLIGVSQTIISGGFVSGTWDQWGSPYIIENDIIIHEDSLLSISGNVDIIFQDTAGLDVYGLLQAVGGKLGTINFDAEVNTWEGIHIFPDSTINDSIIIDHCRISDGAALGSDTNGGGLWIQDRDNVRISWSEFIGNYAERKGGAIYLENSDILLKNSDVVINSTSMDSVNSSHSRGGGIYIKNSDPLFIGVLFFMNESIEGGGVFSTNSTPGFKYCGFQENSCTRHGGAMRCTFNGSVNMEYCELIDNAAGKCGGAISLYYSVLSDFKYVNFVCNGSGSEVITKSGGALFISGCANQKFENCTFLENSSTDWGGAVYAISGSIRLSGCLLSSNTSGIGGAISDYYSDITAVNCTFSNNNAMYYGTTAYSTSGLTKLTNCILWDPFPTSDKYAISLYDNLPQAQACVRVQQSDIQSGLDNISDHSCILLWDNIIDAYPKFLDPVADLSLDWNSPCINAGRSDTMTSMIPEFDLNGDPRIKGSEIDMGAYEYQDPFSIIDHRLTQFSINPNPNNGSFILQLDPGFTLPASLEILNISGRIIDIQKVNSLNMNVRLPRLPDGVYLLKVSGKGKKGLNKILIKN